MLIYRYTRELNSPTKTQALKLLCAVKPSSYKLLPSGHDGRVVVGVDEVGVVGKPTDCKGPAHHTKHLHYLHKTVNNMNGINYS